MTYLEACEFFFSYGNVGRSVDDLLKERPLPHQLKAACEKAITRGQMPEKVNEAREAIEKEWNICYER